MQNRQFYIDFEFNVKMSQNEDKMCTNVHLNKNVPQLTENCQTIMSASESIRISKN